MKGRLLHAHSLLHFQTIIDRLEAPYGQCSNKYYKSFKALYGREYNVEVRILLKQMVLKRKYSMVHS